VVTAAVIAAVMRAGQRGIEKKKKKKRYVGCCV
jgi:hypothetical protein